MAGKVRPIKPCEVAKGKKMVFPDEVLESFNELISQRFSGDSATIQQKDVVKLMIKKGLARKEIFANGWLDVEEVYRSVGWKVEYDKPGYNEAYDANFTFVRMRIKPRNR